MSNSKNATSEQLLQLVAKFAQTIPVDADRGEVQKVIEDGNDPLWAFLKSRFVKKPAEVSREGYPVVVDYSLSLKNQIKVGRYVLVNPDISDDRFRTESQEVLDLELVCFNRVIFSSDAIAELKKMGYRPATLFELLAFGATYIGKQREFSIVALGSVSADRRAAYLTGDDSIRELGLISFNSGWDNRCRFLAVRI